MKQQCLFSELDTTPSPNIDFTTIESFLSYLEYLTDNKNCINTTEGSFGDDSLLDSHKNRSILLVDKYVKCAVPSSQLEFLFESLGIYEYDSSLNGYNLSICQKNDSTSEILSPDITGDHYNPYIRFKSCSSASSRTCSKLLDLAGLEIYNVSEAEPHHNVFLDIVCTFPSELDILLLDEHYRSRSIYTISRNGKRTSQLNIKSHHLIDRMNRCRKTFFDMFNDVHSFGEPDRTLGCSSSLHVWSSAIPVLPNAHVHNLIPFFSYDKTVNRIPELYDIDKSLLDSVVTVEIKTDARKVTRKSWGSTGGSSTFIEEIVLKQKYIVDRDRYKQLRLHLSSCLRDQLHFVPCVWSDSAFPVDGSVVKRMWSDCVYDEFSDILPKRQDLDVHIQFIPWYNKSKLLHALQYKSRPAVLDLELFFQSLMSDLVVDYGKLDLKSVSDFLYYNLEIAISCSNTPDINRYESYLSKLKTVTDRFSSDDIYNWLQFLCTWSTDTRVYGFWRNIKRYMLDPEHELLVEEVVCPICDGSITPLRHVDYCFVDCVVVKSRSKFLIFDVKPPPGGD